MYPRFSKAPEPSRRFFLLESRATKKKASKRAGIICSFMDEFYPIIPAASAFYGRRRNGAVDGWLLPNWLRQEKQSGTPSVVGHWVDASTRSFRIPMPTEDVLTHRGVAVAVRVAGWHPAPGT